MSNCSMTDMGIKTAILHEGKHLTREDRLVIQNGIEAGKSKKSIADSIGKDPSTIAKEIQAHRYPQEKYSEKKYPVDCAGFKTCNIRKKTNGLQCSMSCSRFVPFYCKRRDRTPGACNGCADWAKCRFQKYQYKADTAHSEYINTLSDARQGENLTYDEAKALGSILSKGLQAGQSYFHIKQNNPQIRQSLTTLYNYTRKDTLGLVGVKLLDLRRAVGRKQRRKMSDKTTEQYKKRKDNKHLIGRTYDDFQMYMEQHPNASIVEMDTVYNDVSNGPFMQTFLIRKCMLLIAFYHETKSSEEMLQGIDLLEQILGTELFMQIAEVILTDRGSEFYFAQEAERSVNGNKRTHLYYCDPMASGQKGKLENKHILLRYIFKKDADLRELGLTCQKNLNIAVSHIDSYCIESLQGKSPLAVANFYFPELYLALHKYGIVEVPPEKVYLKPDLFKKKDAVLAAQKDTSQRVTVSCKPQSEQTTQQK